MRGPLLFHNSHTCGLGHNVGSELEGDASHVLTPSIDIEEHLKQSKQNQTEPNQTVPNDTTERCQRGSTPTQKFLKLFYRCVIFEHCCRAHYVCHENETVSLKDVPA